MALSSHLSALINILPTEIFREFLSLTSSEEDLSGVVSVDL